MTSAQLLADVRFLAGDPNNEIWSADTPIYNMLAKAQREFVTRALGSPGIEDHYDVLSELIESTDQSIGVSGLNLSSLDAAKGGIVSLRSILLGDERVYTRMRPSDTGMLTNPFYRGDDYNPKFRVEGNVLYVYVSIGSYPVNVKITYVKRPRDITSSVNPGINAGLHDVLSTMAAGYLLLSNEESNLAIGLIQLSHDFIRYVVSGAEKEPSTGTIGQFTRNRDAIIKQAKAEGA